MSTFPDEYEGLYNLALKQRVSFELENEELAIYTQHQLHAFRRAAENEIPHISKTWRNVVVRRRETEIIMENRNDSLKKALSHLDLDVAKKADEPGDAELEAYMRSLGESNESGRSE